MKQPYSWFFTEWLLVAIFLTLLVLAVLNIGCSPTVTSAQAPLGAQTVNKYDMYGSINQTDFRGVGVVPQAKQYGILVSSRSDVNLISIQTCHRSFSQEDVITTGWFSPNHGFKYVFTPAPGIEDTGSCLIRIGSYNKEVGGQNAWAVIDIATPDTQLPAVSYCDGSQTSGTVTMCQTHAGLVERLVFETPVVTAEKSLPEGCKGALLDGGKIWEYEQPLGECVVIFMEKDKPHRRHRHTTEGFNNVLYRGEK